MVFMLLCDEQEAIALDDRCVYMSGSSPHYELHAKRRTKAAVRLVCPVSPQWEFIYPSSLIKPLTLPCAHFGSSSSHSPRGPLMSQWSFLSMPFTWTSLFAPVQGFF